MRKSRLRKWCGVLNGALMLGLAAVMFGAIPAHELKRTADTDILTAVIWEGCRTEGVRRLKLHFLGNGWRF